jgi:hypothetical protein
MIKISAIAFAIGLTCSSFGQDDLDEMFDDGGKRSKLQIGSDAVIIGGGTPNIYLDYRILTNVETHTGFGVIPFGFLLDITGWRLNSIPLFSKNLQAGFYHNVGLRIFPYAGAQHFFKNFYINLEWERWQFQTHQYFSARRNKINFGGGIKSPLAGRFNVDLNLGIFGGWERIKGKGETIPIGWQAEVRGYNMDSSDQNINTSETLIGFNGFLGISYDL